MNPYKIYTLQASLHLGLFSIISINTFTIIDKNGEVAHDSADQLREINIDSLPPILNHSGGAEEINF